MFGIRARDHLGSQEMEQPGCWTTGGTAYTVGFFPACLATHPPRLVFKWRGPGQSLIHLYLKGFV